MTWETCTLHTWLNSEFINEAFSEEERAVIPMVEIPSDNSEENATMDQVFLLSEKEIEKYFTDRQQDISCYNTDYAIANGAYLKKTVWWLRSVSLTAYIHVVETYSTSISSYYMNSSHISVRPALWIDLNALE